MNVMKKMAKIVDNQNEKDPAYSMVDQIIKKCQMILKTQLHFLQLVILFLKEEFNPLVIQSLYYTKKD